MKKEVSPVVAVVIVVAVLAVAIGFLYFRADKRAGTGGDQPPGMSPEVAAEFQRRMGSVTGPTAPPGGGTTGPTLPSQGGGTTGPTLPPQGGGANAPMLPTQGR